MESESNEISDFKKNVAEEIEGVAEVDVNSTNQEDESNPALLAMAITLGVIGALGATTIAIIVYRRFRNRSPGASEGRSDVECSRSGTSSVSPSED